MSHIGGEQICDSLILSKRTILNGGGQGGRVKNFQKLFDVIYECSETEFLSLACNDGRKIIFKILGKKE
jgi:hypothetical protein